MVDEIYWIFKIDGYKIPHVRCFDILDLSIKSDWQRYDW